MSTLNKKNIAKSRILNYMLNHFQVTKVELSKELNLSMPTVLSNVNDLIEKGLIEENGELESTGGRKARTLGFHKDFCYSLGVDITAHHIGIVLVNLAGEVIKHAHLRKNFTSDLGYCSELARLVTDFYATENIPENKILGIGISLPGIVNNEDRGLTKSHALCLENYSLKLMEQLLPFPLYFENDANAAMLAENPQLLNNAIYLSLKNTLGGAICINGKLYTGKNQKAGEFGHMIIEPDGKTCYCGKKGCADVYCAASALLDVENDTLEKFMLQIGKTAKADIIWEDYLEHLAILITNLRMAFDTDIILGGDVGGYLGPHMVSLSEKILKYNLFDGDTSYLKICSYKTEASAVGVAKHFFQVFIEHI